MTAVGGHYASLLPQDYERDMNYLQRHHLTNLPASLEPVRDQCYTLKLLEDNFRFRLCQAIGRDTVRYSGLMQVIRSKGKRQHAQDDSVLRIFKEDFPSVLTRLGVFHGGEENAFALFNKLDYDSRGYITVHELLNRSAPADFDPNAEFMKPAIPNKNKRIGVKYYAATAILGTPVEARLPKDNVYRMTINKMCEEVANKMDGQAQVGKTNSYPRARRILSRHFEFYDRFRVGYIEKENLKKTLDRINYPLDDPHLDLLINTFPGPVAESGKKSFDYTKFILKCYPEPTAEIYTGLPLRKDMDQALWDFMQSVDADGDGLVSLDEMAAFKKNLPLAKTPPPMTPPSREGLRDNQLALVAGLTTHGAPPIRTSRPGSRAGSMTSRGPSRQSRYSRPPSGSMTHRAPASRPMLSQTYTPRAPTPSMQQMQPRAPITRTPTPPVSARYQRNISRPGSRAV
jgi:Ca2+-binding EF-hand superfamily protein